MGLALLVASCTASHDVDCPVSRCDVIIDPGPFAIDELVAASAQAEAGHVIYLAPGEYGPLKRELQLSAEGMVLLGAGAGETILDFGEQVVGEAGVAILGRGITVEGLSIHDPRGAGLRAEGADDLHLAGIEVDWAEDAGRVGIDLVGGAEQRVEGCRVQGGREAALRVIDATRVGVFDGRFENAATGLFLDHCEGCELRDNHIEGVTRGIVVANLPESGAENAGGTKVWRNDLREIRADAYGVETPTLTPIPRGAALTVLASTGNELHDNRVEGADGPGVFVLSHASELFGSWQDPSFAWLAEGNDVHDNDLRAVGERPQGFFADAAGFARVPALVWDGCLAEGSSLEELPSEGLNCFADNDADDDPSFVVDLDLCDGFTEPSDSLPILACAHASLPSLD